MKPSLACALACAAALGLGFPTLLAAEAINPSSSSRDLFDNPVLAKGNGFEIRQNEVDQMVVGLKATLASTRNQTIPEGQREQVAAQMLDRLVLTRMLQLKATDADKAKAKEVANKFIANTKAKTRSEEAYRRQLIASGITPELFETRALEQAIVEAVIDREVKSKLSVSDPQIREFYDHGIDLLARDILGVIARLEKDNQTNTVFYGDGLKRLDEVKQANLQRLQRVEQVKAQVIVIQTIDRATGEEFGNDELAARKQRAQKALEQLKAGDDFPTVAKAFSEDLEVERTGGEYTVTRDAVAYPELRAALFTLPVGQISDLITTRVGYYLVKVLERTPAGKVPFDKAENEIRELLLSQEVQKALPAFVDQLKKDFNVSYPSSTNAPAAR